MSYPESWSCRRCGQLAEVEWCEVTTLGDHDPSYIAGRSWCETPGCVDLNGSSRVRPPRQPGELTDNDQDWVSYHLRLAGA